MKKVSSLLAASLLVGGLASTALAADDPSSAATGSSSHVTTTTKGTSGGMMAKEFKADQTLHGTISGIDQNKGSFTLKTDEGQNLMLNFPPEALKNYKEGDHVALNLALSKWSGPMESMR
jgi:hypothetical protein